MHVIAMYDIKEKRVGKVLKVFRKYLTWIQLSVFEGEISESKLERLKLEVKEIVEEAEDSVVFFELPYPARFTKSFVGKEFDPFDNIL